MEVSGQLQLSGRNKHYTGQQDTLYLRWSRAWA